MPSLYITVTSSQNNGIYGQQSNSNHMVPPQRPNAPKTELFNPVGHQSSCVNLYNRLSGTIFRDQTRNAA